MVFLTWMWYNSLMKQFNTSMVRDIFQRDSGMCIYCGGPATEIDHVVSLKEGGPTIRANGVCVCRHCNRLKKNHTDDIDYQTRAIFWLLQQGEDMKWLDDFLAQ